MDNHISFAAVIDGLKKGLRFTRSAWGFHVTGAFIFLVQGSNFTVNRAPLLGIFPAGTEIIYRPHIDIVFGDGTVGVFKPSDADLLAEDWIELAEAAVQETPAAFGSEVATAPVLVQPVEQPITPEEPTTLPEVPISEETVQEVQAEASGHEPVAA